MSFYQNNTYLLKGNVQQHNITQQHVAISPHHSAYNTQQILPQASIYAKTII